LRLFAVDAFGRRGFEGHDLLVIRPFVEFDHRVRLWDDTLRIPLREERLHLVPSQDPGLEAGASLYAKNELHAEFPIVMGLLFQLHSDHTLVGAVLREIVKT
jgi:hypothetical protein